MGGGTVVVWWWSMSCPSNRSLQLRIASAAGFGPRSPVRGRSAGFQIATADICGVASFLSASSEVKFLAGIASRDPLSLASSAPEGEPTTISLFNSQSLQVAPFNQRCKGFLIGMSRGNRPPLDLSRRPPPPSE